jgi:formate dehydrogenase subunit delta
VVTEGGSSELEKLAYMANQIANFFRPYPEQAARDGIRKHIISFWTLKMRAELVAHADGLKLDPLVRAVLPGLG